MKTIAYRGHGSYLIVPDGVTELEADTPGRVFNCSPTTGEGILYPWQYAHQILNFGYWEYFDSDDSPLEFDLASALAGAERVEGEFPSGPDTSVLPK